MPIAARQTLSKQNQALWSQVQESESRQALIMDKVSRLLRGMMVAYSALRAGGNGSNRISGRTCTPPFSPVPSHTTVVRVQNGLRFSSAQSRSRGVVALYCVCLCISVRVQVCVTSAVRAVRDDVSIAHALVVAVVRDLAVGADLQNVVCTCSPIISVPLMGGTLVLLARGRLCVHSHRCWAWHR